MEKCEIYMYLFKVLKGYCFKLDFEELFLLIVILKKNSVVK